MPITVGGGIKSLDYMRELLFSGADKISINTAAIEDVGLVKNAANFFGNQCVVISIDYARRKKMVSRGYIFLEDLKKLNGIL